MEKLIFEAKLKRAQLGLDRAKLFLALIIAQGGGVAFVSSILTGSAAIFTSLPLIILMVFTSMALLHSVAQSYIGYTDDDDDNECTENHKE